MTQAKEQIDWFKKPKPDLTLEEMKEDLLRYVEYYDWVSIAELTHWYDDQAKGDYQWVTESDDNMIFYAGLSEKLISALRELLREKKVHLHPASLLTYLVDGGMLKLPLARKPPRGGYKELHWLPICLRPGSECAIRECPARIRAKKIESV